ncbi:MAG: 16S rRNA (adenine(1518)-N(6)/adenine(1519)-N(6))-dimethyltransferase RsmA [Vulcanimicrobiaceae bacterium]
MGTPKSLLAHFGLRPKKRLGQNFLIDAGLAGRIAQLALDDGDAHLRVLEIGAGTGTLTQALLEAKADVTALELDPDLIPLLAARPELAAARIFQADALTYDYASYAATGPWRVAANLPYNVATPLMLALVAMPNGPERLILMIQKDVADRLLAAPGTAAYGSLTVAIRNTMVTTRAFTIGPTHFHPRPKIDSSVVVLTRRTQPLVAIADPARFEQVVRGAFAYRRKTLANSLCLALGLDRAVIRHALDACALEPEIRGERLDLADFARVADALAAERL